MLLRLSDPTDDVLLLKMFEKFWGVGEAVFLASTTFLIAAVKLASCY